MKIKARKNCKCKNLGDQRDKLDSDKNCRI